MFGLSLEHLIILFVVVLLFGSKRLPDLGNALGKSINSFKKGLEGKADEERPKIAQEEKPKTDSKV